MYVKIYIVDNMLLNIIGVVGSQGGYMIKKSLSRDIFKTLFCISKKHQIHQNLILVG